jgi:DUF1680 family protein
MAAAEASFFRAYRSRPSSTSETTTWVQIDLGSPRPINAIRLYPAATHLTAGDGFPLRFRLECSRDEDFHTAEIIADRTNEDYPHPQRSILQFPATGTIARYVRLTATRLRGPAVPSFLEYVSSSDADAYRKAIAASQLYVLSLAKIEVLSGNADIAVSRPVTLDLDHGNPEDAQQITRKLRAQGEGINTDNAGNITSATTWNPVAEQVHAPRANVRLGDGLFAEALRNNALYLKNSYSVDQLLLQFRERAGKPSPPRTRRPQGEEEFWVQDLAGSNAGRFLMGAANTLRWIDDPELRSRVQAVVSGIEECRQANGYIMAYPEDTFFVSERGAYTRSWLTQGLIAAGYAGSVQAFTLLRGYYDWYNQRAYLPQALRGAIQGGQGMVANTQLYFTPVGKPQDLQVIQRYFQEDYWLEMLASRDLNAIWQYPYDRPHVYLLTNLLAYSDLYRATGERKYLQAVLGGWEMFRDNWQSPGGSFALIELAANRPKSYPLNEPLGETCGSAFWTLLNGQLHRLFPDEEKYVAEIEKSIYNVLLANQAGSDGIRYHTRLLGQKELPNRINTCCEGQGTRLLSSLPEYIYSLADDGVYVNLFEASTIDWQHGGETLRLEQQTGFLRKGSSVRLKVQCANPITAKIRVRIPSWAAEACDLSVNNMAAGRGARGSYFTLDRKWSSGDVISLDVPMAFKLRRYDGIDVIPERQRFVLEYGPLLMAAVGVSDEELTIRLASKPEELGKRLRPSSDHPLHFACEQQWALDTEFIPYFEIQNQMFTCAPFITTKETLI